MIKALIGALALLLWAGTAQANTMTFVNLPFGGGMPPLTYTENGITAFANSGFGGPGYFGSPGRAHLDPGGTPYPSTMEFTLTSLESFDAISFDLFPSGFRYCASTDSPICPNGPDEYKNVLVQGFVGAILVAQDLFSMGAAPTTHLFGEGWTGLSRLVIAVVLPPRNEGMCLPTGECSHFNIDNVTLAPVPLPPALALFATSCTLLGLMRRRRRRLD